MRVREYSSDTLITTELRNANLLTGSDAAYVSLNIGCEESESQKTTDVVTPRFKIRQKQGEVIVNPYTSMRSKLTCRSAPMWYILSEYRLSTGEPLIRGKIYVSNGRWSSRQRAPRTPMALMDSTSLAAELSLYDMAGVAAKGQTALAQALDNSSGTEALALVSLAELDKTVDLFRSGIGLVNQSVNLLESIPSSTRKRLNTVLAAVGRIKTSRGRRQFLNTVTGSLRGLASAWLGYRYGIMATYYDINSWIAAGSQTNKRARFVSGTFDQFENIGTPFVSFSSNYVATTERVIRRRRSQIRAGVLIDAKALTTADRFGVTRLLSTAWELIPFSFVVDWFADVGTRLSAWEGGLSVRPLGSWISIEHNMHYVHSYTNEWLQTDNIGADRRYVGEGNDDGITEELCVMRERIANPKLGVLPQVNVKLNWKRLADSAALATVLSSKLKKLL